MSAATYGRCEGVDRDRYYAGLIDPASVMDREPIQRLLADLNAARPETLFYLDNETPKCRYGHIWWFGWHYDVPAWHDYSQDRPITYWDGDPEREINPLTGEPHRRRPYLEIVAAQRARGALAVWAHPTSWWTEQDRFVTNIAAEAPLHLLADGRLDGFAVMGYDPFHRGYQRLWWTLLDSGAVIPGFAETDTCFDRRNLLEDPHALVNRLPVGARPTLAAIVAAARAGGGFATSGPFLRLVVDGAAMGATTPTAAGLVHRVEVEAHPAPGETALARVDLIGRGGEVLASVERFTGGMIEFAVPGLDAAGWLVARAIGEHDDLVKPQKQIRHCALTNPVYLHPRGRRCAPLTTALRLGVRGDSPWLGGTIRLEDAAGGLIESARIVPGDLVRELPASARATLVRDGRPPRTFYLAMENAAVQQRLRYLWAGGFRADHAGLAAGDVPTAAFDLAAMRAAAARCAYAI